jgi:hypothetical protein
MYDMYPWDSASQGDYPPRPMRSVKDSGPAAKAARATARHDFSPAQAVQIALDRRDNGGEAEQAAPAPAASQARQ